MPSHTPAEIVAILREHGIEAQEHELGLALHCRDAHEYARALKRCIPQPTVLRVLTMEGDQGVEQTTPPCRRDAMICQCEVHEAERVTSIRRGPRDVAQPWQTRRRAA